MTPSFTANADYKVIDRAPLKLAVGDSVKVTAPDRAWPGWVGILTSSGKTGHIPADFLDISGENATVVQAFDSTDLCVVRGDQVISLLEIHGWHWCEKPASGETGWLASYLLTPEN